MSNYVLTAKEALDVLEKYHTDKPKYVAIDTETTGLQWDTHEAFLIQVGWGWGDNYAFPVQFSREVAEIIEDPSSEKVLHNAKFDTHFLENLGIKVAGKVHDSQVMARLLLSGNESIALDDLATHLIDQKAGEADKALRKWMKQEKTRRSKQLTTELRKAGYTRKAYDNWKKENIPLPPEVLEIEKSVDLNVTYEDVPLEIMEKYATGDVRHTLALFNKFRPIIKSNNLTNAYERDMQTISYVYNWERRGMSVDLPYLEEGIEYGELKLKELEQEIHTIAGRELNTNSPKQILGIFHERGLPIKATDEETLEGIAAQDPLASKIVEYRKHGKIVGTYFKPIYERAKRTGGTIHANFNVAGPVTGRFSSSDPNLQNIPNHNLGEKLNVRRAFIPSNGYSFVFMDYSQMEVIIMAEYSGDENLIQAILNKEDLHTKTALSIDPRAKEVYLPGVPKDEQPPEFQKIRSMAKATTFGIFYGIGASTLSKNLKIDIETARQYIRNFFLTYPRIEAFMRAVQNTAQRRPGRYVINKFGRVYWGVEGREYALANYLIQGTGADMIKTAIDRCEKLLQGYKSRIVLMVHDELIFEIADGEQHLIPLLKEQMTYFPTFKLPIEVGIEYSSTSWAEPLPWRGQDKKQTA
ncbi:hypothetical protein DCC39_10355 [Pueribacillus theae]|uniref:DNA polymerase I n=1 Tax=Pueribacillus theae TaxID=2171751 RepID=A0A2U1K0U1_9BACI|nr:DNA polymerase [Pueribacillus theae]PWA11091.1 hypothetical protein DCC39_10355 [Pueribacillus theae]